MVFNYDGVDDDDDGWTIIINYSDIERVEKYVHC
jgi:hypothetical protein